MEAIARKKQSLVFLYLLLDAFAYTYFLYTLVDATLLWRETAIPFYLVKQRLLYYVPLVALLSLVSPFREIKEGVVNVKITLGLLFGTIFLIWAFPVLNFLEILIPVLLVLAVLPWWKIPWRIRSCLFDVGGFLLLGFFAPCLASIQQPFVKKELHTAVSLLWFPIEWHKLSMNISLLAKSFPFFTGLILVINVVCLYFLLFRDEKRKVAWFYVLMAFLIGSRISYVHASQRRGFFWVVFGFPYLMMALAAYYGKQKIFSRFSVLAMAFTVLWGFYTAFLPVTLPFQTNLPHGFTRIYPTVGEKKQFPTEYMRDVYVQEEQGHLFTCYGPTSGIVRLNINTGQVNLYRTRGLLRHFWTDASSPLLYAVDWIFPSVWFIQKSNFKVRKKDLPWDSILTAPIDIEVSRENIFVVSTEYPSITRFSRKRLKKTGQIDFRASGLTRFKSGAWALVRDSVKEKLFVEMGMVNAKDEFAVARVDEKTFQVDSHLVLPSGGLTMIGVPEKRTLLLGDFYSHFLYEIDMGRMKVKRRIPAVLNCRSLAYDPKRDLIYAASFLTGEMAVLRYRDGKILKKAFVGKKPSEIFYSKAQDALYFGSSFGVFKVDIETFLESL